VKSIFHACTSIFYACNHGESTLDDDDADDKVKRFFNHQVMLQCFAWLITRAVHFRVFYYSVFE